jgi:L-Ala-D/L-Glu epimerase
MNGPRRRHARRPTPHAPVAAVAATAVAIPYERPLALATGIAREHCAVLVELADGDGHSGWGEIAPGPGTTRDAATAIALRLAACGERLAKLANRHDDHGAYEIPEELRAGVEAALLDLRARRDGASLYRMLGGDGAAPSAVAVNAMIDRGDADRTRRAIDGAVAAGFGCLKLKLAPHRLDDCEVALRYARDAHGDAIALRVDCNGQWSLDEARRALRRLEPFGLEYVEQPVAGLDELRALRGATSVRIAADESASDLTQIERAIDIGAVDVLVLKPALLGARDSLRAAAAARAAGIDCVVASNLETSLGVAAATHVAAIVDAERPDRRRAHGLGTVGLLAGDVATPRMLPQRGKLAVPTAPGCGVIPAAEQLDRFRIDRG